jgi:hypothetical protein
VSTVLSRRVLKLARTCADLCAAPDVRLIDVA